MAPQRLRLEQFAALRALLSGMHPTEACRRYLSGESIPSSESTALKRLIELLRIVATTAATRPTSSSEVALAVNAASVLAREIGIAEERRLKLRARELLRRLSRSAGSVEVVSVLLRPIESVPVAGTVFQDIESFRQDYIDSRLDGIDPDIGEDEWEALFEDYLGELAERSLSTSSGPGNSKGVVPYNTPLSAITHAGIADAQESQLLWAPTNAQDALAALETCRWIVDRHPKGSDSLSTWLKGNVVNSLRAAGIAQLQALADLIARRGRRWWTAVPGLGPTRAAHLEAWLRDVGPAAEIQAHTETFARASTASATQNSSKVHSEQRQRLVQVGLGPLGELLGPGFSQQDLALPRAVPHDVFSTQDDLDALVGALERYRDRPATLTVYGREITRFVLWCHRVRKKQLPNVTMADAQAYADFLDAIPEDWINPVPAQREAVAWRPFRGALDPASKRKSLSSVHVVLGLLQSTGYLSGNPMSPVLKGRRSDGAGSDSEPVVAFGPDEWRFIADQLEEVSTSAGETPRADDARLRRLQALVHLVRSTRMLPGECAGANWSQFAPNPCGDGGGVLHVGTVSNGRSIEITPDVVKLLIAHHRDWGPRLLDLVDETHVPGQDPLFGALSPAPGERHANADATAAAAIERETGGLGTAGIQRILRGFLAHCASQASAHGLDPERFRRASVASLRR